mmetsp:Transcript_28157/g.69343  ORF Transcript_28157/g.69343 Transcript_28157/m.69343 type:complete len:286 (-) Transcript_28157:657-1514(-)
MKELLSAASATSMSSSESYTLANPLKYKPSLPVILATEPSGARLPYRHCRCPVALMGSEMGLITCCPVLRSGHDARFSAMVLPVTVMQLPSISPSFSRYLSTPGVPPTLCRSSITYLPLGLRSAMKGVRSDTAWKSSRVSVMPTECAMAMMCSTALVEPPRAMMITMEFSKAARVMMSRGLRSMASRCFMALPAMKHSSIFSGSSAGMDDEYGSVMPSASMAEAMVLAVYMPPHAPAPGHEFFTMSLRSSSVMAPVTNCPYDWNADTMSSGSPVTSEYPGLMVPP